jgi:hypothetical protein
MHQDCYTGICLNMFTAVKRKHVVSPIQWEELTCGVLNIAGPSQEELWKIREAIKKASSLEEVERLNRLLQSGQIPGRGKLSSKGECQLLLIGLIEWVGGKAPLILRLEVSYWFHVPVPLLPQKERLYRPEERCGWHSNSSGHDVATKFTQVFRGMTLCHWASGSWQLKAASGTTYPVT